MGVTNVLPNGILIWEEFRRHFLINDGDAACVFVLTVGLGEIAATQQLYTEGIAVTRRYGSEE